MNKISDDTGEESPIQSAKKRSLFSRIFKGNNKNDSRLSIKSLIAKEEVNLLPEEAFILKNTLRVHNTCVQDIMIPRVEIQSLYIDTPPNELFEAIISKLHSRMPVFEETLDKPLGMIHIKDVLRVHYEGKVLDLRNILRDILYVPGTMRVLELLAEMRISHTHMALVVDEYGGTDGIISIEDLLEEIVGDIEDEHDDEQDDDLFFKQESPSVIMVDARTELEVIEEVFNISFTEEEKEDVDTIGGLLSKLIGRVPVQGELFETNTLSFETMESNPRVVRKLKLTLNTQDVNDQDKDQDHDHDQNDDQNDDQDLEQDKEKNKELQLMKA